MKDKMWYVENMRFSTEYITPEKARNYLATSNGNRSSKRYDQLRLRNAMLTNNFWPTHQGIAFDENGHLFDGHHRLEEIINTKKPQYLVVARNAPNIASIDTGSQRSVKDQLYMAGVITKQDTEWDSRTQPLVSMILTANYGVIQTRIATGIDRHNIYLKFKDVIDATINCLYCTKYTSNRITYPMACAINDGVPMETVKEWHKILCTGDFFSDDEEQLKAGRSVLLVKRYLDESKALRDNNQETLTNCIKKVMASINYFHKKQPINRLYGENIYRDLIIEL